MNILTCPVCGEKLNIFGKTLKCDNNHSFDFAKQRYVNLLLTSKSGDKKGDSRESAHARREFLQKGYYSFLRDYVNSKLNGTVLDICCGEDIMTNIPASFTVLISARKWCALPQPLAKSIIIL